MILGNKELLKLLTSIFIDLMIRDFKLVTRGFELLTRRFELVICEFELATRTF